MYVALAGLDPASDLSEGQNPLSPIGCGRCPLALNYLKDQRWLHPSMPPSRKAKPEQETRWL